MSDTGREFALISDHAENLHSGRMVTPAERVTEADLDPDGRDQWLIDAGRLSEVEKTDPPSAAALKARARELGIEGRSSMSADELQAAVTEAERPIVAAASDGVAEGDVREGGGS